jgi:ribosomal protein L11 methyltransferase
VPYRIDISTPPKDALDVLVEFGALDLDMANGVLAAIMPDAVDVAVIARRLGVPRIQTASAIGRDDGSVWTLRLRPTRVGTFTIVPADTASPADGLVIADGPVFGTGLHPTTAMSVEAIERAIGDRMPSRILDVGTGSGILALAALSRGVAHAIGVDLDAEALDAAAVNARLNGLSSRLHLVLGSAEAIGGAWPLVVANIRAAELIEIAPALVRRLASQGRLILSGVAAGVVDDVERTYRRLGVVTTSREARGGWSALQFRASY